MRIPIVSIVMLGYTASSAATNRLMNSVGYVGLHILSRPPDPVANNESSEVFDIIKPGRRVKIKGYRWILKCQFYIIASQLKN